MNNGGGWVLFKVMDCAKCGSVGGGRMWLGMNMELGAFFECLRIVDLVYCDNRFSKGFDVLPYFGFLVWVFLVERGAEKFLVCSWIKT